MTNKSLRIWTLIPVHETRRAAKLALTLLPVVSTAPRETNDSQDGTSSVTLIAVSLVICLLPAPPPLQTAALSA